MYNLLSLIIAAGVIFVAVECSIIDATHLGKRHLDMDNRIPFDVVPTPKRRLLLNYVKISKPPPETMKLVPGSVMVLQCEVAGRPAPSVRWLHNGQLIDDFEMVTNEILAPHPSSIGYLVSKLVLPTASNGDIYTCVASAGEKTDAASTTVYSETDDLSDELLTLRKLMNSPTKPIITSHYDFIFQDQGTDLLLPCRYASITKPQIFWVDTEDKLIYGNTRRRLLPSGDLVITDLQYNTDMGGYTCKVKNAYGDDSATTFVYPLQKTQEN